MAKSTDLVDPMHETLVAVRAVTRPRVRRSLTLPDPLSLPPDPHFPPRLAAEPLRAWPLSRRILALTRSLTLAVWQSSMGRASSRWGRAALVIGERAGDVRAMCAGVDVRACARQSSS